MATLRFISFDALGLFRRLTILVDGVVVARLKSREHFELSVETGQHVLRTRMDYHGSPELVVQVRTDDEVVQIEVSSAVDDLWSSVVRPSRCMRIRRLPIWQRFD